MNNTCTFVPGESSGGTATMQETGEYLFLALECHGPPARHARFYLGDLREILVGRAAGSELEVESLAIDRLAIGIPDRCASRRHAVLRRDGDGWRVRDLDSKNGSQLDGARLTEAALGEAQVLELGRSLFLYRRFVGSLDFVDAEARCHPLRGAGIAPAGPSIFRTLSPALQRQLHRLRRAAPSPLPVLIRGESGTGKEVAARAIHTLSGRSGPFVAVNCGALSPGLLESELFGHARGAFSGATESRPGLIRAAHGGTLFLDELAEAPHAVQVKLLRVLQEREVVPVGATAPVPVDVRIVAATHGDVFAMAQQGQFRQDFLARLTGFEIALPPLRERPEDIGHLAAGFLRAALGDRAARVTIDPAVGRALLRHDWPLNVRELERVISAAAVLIEGDKLSLAALSDRLGDGAELDSAAGRDRPGDPPPPSFLPEGSASGVRAPGQVTRERLLQLLRHHGGNISAVARALSTSRSHVHRLIARHDISLSDYRPDES